MTCPRELNRLMERYNVANARAGIEDRAYMLVDGEGRMRGAMLRGREWDALSAAEWLRAHVAP
jgi:hypothetical protein